MKNIKESLGLKHSYSWKIVILLVALFFMFIIALCCGHYAINPLTCFQLLVLKPFGISGNWTRMDDSVFWSVRLPRIIGAMMIGASLSVSGASYQSVFQNPLVSPDILGVSSGACIGASLGLLLHLSNVYVMILSFSLGVLTVLITTTIPKLIKSTSNIVLVLSGIIVGGLTSSVMGFIKYMADPTDTLPRITYWTMGSLDRLTFSIELVMIIPLAISFIILLRMSWWIDIISMGEKDAKTLGANVSRIRAITICGATLLTAISVSTSGTIGWIGLVIPHFARFFVGPSNTKLLPVSALMGAIFLLFVDTIARNIAMVEVPLSIITGLIGAPSYAWFLHNQRDKLN